MANNFSFNLGDCVDSSSGGTFVVSGSGGTSPWLSGPAKIVTDHVDIAHEYASQSFDNTWCFLTGLAELSPMLNELTYQVSFDDIPAPDPTLNLPEAPVAPDATLYVPTFPATFAPGDIHEYDENAVGTVPTFTEQTPDVNLPAQPGALDATAPTDAPTITGEYDFPTAVSYTLPTVPTFEELNIPTAPTIDIPTFELEYPTVPSDLVVPGLTFGFSEDTYSSALMTALTAELLDRIQNGGTGLSSDVEQAIWDRARNREDQNAVRSENQINVEQASKGFSRPSGAHMAALDQLAQETQNKNADLSREIAIKQAELEQENIKFALQTSLALEQAWLQNYNQVQQRAFEVEKYTQQVAIDLYQAQIAQFNVQLEVYKTYASAFESRVRAALAEAEVYRTELEGEKVRGDLNLQKVELYKAQLSGIETAVEVYKSEVDAIKTQIEADGLQIQNFRTLVDSYSAQVQAKASEYQMYSAAVQGEMAKVDIYDKQIRAYVSRVDAYAKRADVETKLIQNDIEVQGLRLKEYLARLDSVVKNTQAQATVSQAKLEAFRGEAMAYEAAIKAETVRLDAENKVYDLKIEQARYASEVELKNASINIENANNSVKLILEALKSGASVGSSLAAASLSAMNIGASISGSSSDIHNYTQA